MLHLEDSFVWCCNFDTSVIRSEMPGKFWDVVLEKDGEDQLDRSREKEELLHSVKDERNILHNTNRRKANWIGHILHRNCLLKHIIEAKIEGRIEMMERRGRRRKQLLDDLKETRGYWKLKEEALDTLYGELALEKLWTSRKAGTRRRAARRVTWYHVLGQQIVQKRQSGYTTRRSSTNGGPAALLG